MSHGTYFSDIHYNDKQFIQIRILYIIYISYGISIKGNITYCGDICIFHLQILA